MQGRRMIFTKCSHSIATHLGPDAAWVFGVIEYWTLANARKRKPQSVKNGIYCCYLSWADWHRELPFLSERTIRRCVAKLKETGIIAVFEGDSNSGKANYFTIDQKGWLSFQAWSSGMILSVEDGRALTPIDEQVSDYDFDFDFENDHFESEGVVTLAKGGGQADQGGVVTLASSAHTLETKNKNIKDKRNTFCTEGPADRSARRKAENKPSDGSLIFEAYSEAYQQRYKLEPLRNAKVNSICAQIAKQVPLDEAKAIMHFYLRQNVSWYVQKGHAIEYAQKDLQALRTNMMKNQTMSTHAANNADKIAAQKQALENFNERQNHQIDESAIFGGDLRESDDFRKPLGLLRSKT